MKFITVEVGIVYSVFIPLAFASVFNLPDCIEPCAAAKGGAVCRGCAHDITSIRSITASWDNGCGREKMKDHCGCCSWFRRIGIPRSGCEGSRWSKCGHGCHSLCNSSIGSLCNVGTDRIRISSRHGGRRDGWNTSHDQNQGCEPK